MIVDSGRRNRDGSTGRRGRPTCRRRATAVRTTAPAPSPNSTQVPRSSQSRMREKVSAPITSARAGLAGPDEIVGDRQRDRRSRSRPPGCRRRRRGSCRAPPGPGVAVAGKVSSGVLVASTMRSTSAALEPGAGQRRLGGLGRQIGGQLALGRRYGAGGCRCAARSSRRWCRRAAASSSLVTTRRGR